MARVVGFVEAPALGLDLPLDVRGTAFQQRVWQALRAIPPGATASYAEIAARDRRAEGGARRGRRLRRQRRIAVAIPCHRVVRSDGALSGYRWGVERKRDLLAAKRRDERHLFAATAIALDPGAVLLPGFAGEEAEALLAAIAAIAAAAPFRRMETPGGRRMSVAMTNAGTAGWTTSRRGYRYTAADPETGTAWPAMPDAVPRARRRAPRRWPASPASCPTPASSTATNPARGWRCTRIATRRDLARRSSPSRSACRRACSGAAARAATGRAAARWFMATCVVWGGPARLTFHGIAPLAAGDHPLTGAVRYNLTLRKAGAPPVRS